MDLVDLEATRSGAVAAKAREASEEEGGDVALVLQVRGMFSTIYRAV